MRQTRQVLSPHLPPQPPQRSSLIWPWSLLRAEKRLGNTRRAEVHAKALLLCSFTWKPHVHDCPARHKDPCLLVLWVARCLDAGQGDTSATG
jgi:hypothetical protein